MPECVVLVSPVPYEGGSYEADGLVPSNGYFPVGTVFMRPIPDDYQRYMLVHKGKPVINRLSCSGHYYSNIIRKHSIPYKTTPIL